MNSTSITTRLLGKTMSLDDLTMFVCVGGGLYFWLARGKKFGELGLASVMSVGSAFIAVKFNNLLLHINAVEPDMLVSGYKIILMSIGFDSFWSYIKNADWSYER